MSNNDKLKEAQEKLLRLVDELRQEIAKDMYHRVDQAKKHYKQSLWTCSGATALALLLLLTLVYLFSGWVFSPLKQLQAGVNRVAQGNFGQPIELKSGDELEELGNAFNDMTARLHDIYRDLERQVNERSRQLVRSERMVSVGFLAAGVAHEINNPLASIAFCSEALQSRLGDYLRRHPQETEVVAKYLSMIQQEAFRCKEITGKLLEFSRAGERRREPAELAGLIQSVLEIAQHLQNCRGKRIIFQPYAQIVAGVNAQDIKSVVLNLVVNALDSMDDGGVLTITLMQRGGLAEMVFTDTGCGMAPEVLENIFEPFYTRSRTGKGTGLGLFISHQIIDQHGGRIEARKRQFEPRKYVSRSACRSSRRPDGRPGTEGARRVAVWIRRQEEAGRESADGGWNWPRRRIKAFGCCSSMTRSRCKKSCGKRSPVSAMTSPSVRTAAPPWR